MVHDRVSFETPKRPPLPPRSKSKLKFEPWRWIHEAPRLDWENLAPNILKRGNDVDRSRPRRRSKEEEEHGRHRGKSEGEKAQDKAMASAKEREKEERPGWMAFIFTRHDWEKQARYAPLIAAVFAPLATLLDIPGLSQHWYDLNGTPQPDPIACLVLSAIGLALNVIANAFLILRFSSQDKWWWRHATTWSLIFWIAKTVVAAVNLIYFGVFTRDAVGYSFAEGFWCAVVSILDAGIISIALLIHYFVTFRKHEDNNEVRAEGKRFMLSVTFFVAVLGIQALVFSRIEGWVYLDAIYFSVQVALTIGYGDFTPSTAAGKVLIFPFAVLTISQLGNEISLILGFIQTRAEERRGRWRKRYEKAMHDEANALRPKASLMEEMALIYQINKRENMMSQIYDLGWSALCLVVFWAVGAAMFSAIEGWSFGNGVYAVMILSFTIGFGDFVPDQPASRVIFVVYALMAVPIVTSFAVQTITGLLSTYSRRTAMHDSFVRDRKEYPEAFKPHADFVLRAHESYGDMRKRLLGDYTTPEPPPIEGENASSDEEEKHKRNGANSDVPEGSHEDAASSSSSVGGDHQQMENELKVPTEAECRAATPNSDSDEGVVVNPSNKQQDHSDRKMHPSKTEPLPGSSSTPRSGSPRLFADSANPDLEDFRKQQRRKKLEKGSIKVTKDLSGRKNLFFPQMDYGEGYNDREQQYREEFKKMKEIMQRRHSRLEEASHKAKEHLKPNHRVDPVKPKPTDDQEHHETHPPTSPEASGGDDGPDPSYGPTLPAGDEADDETAVASSSKSHRDLPSRHHRSKDGRRQRERLRKRHGGYAKVDHEDDIPKVPREHGGDDEDESEEEYKDDCDWQQLHLNLTKQLMELTVRLEAEARQLIVDSMDPGVARTLLLADRNVQIRDVKALRGDDVNILKIWRGEKEKDEEDTKRLGRGADEKSPAAQLQRVKRYRNTFAEVLVVGSILQQLKGEEWGQFVRLNHKVQQHRRNEHGDEPLPEPFGPRKIFGEDKSKVEEKIEKFGRALTV